MQDTCLKSQYLKTTIILIGMTCLVLIAGCLGFHTGPEASKQQVMVPPMLSSWEGDYGGNVHIRSPHKAEKQMYPATLTIHYYAPYVVIKFNVPNFTFMFFDQKKSKPGKLRKDIAWTIKIKPEKFADSHLNLYYETKRGNSKALFLFNADKVKGRLTGKFQRGHKNRSGAVTLFESFEMAFVKIN